MIRFDWSRRWHVLLCRRSDRTINVDRKGLAKGKTDPIEKRFDGIPRWLANIGLDFFWFAIKLINKSYYLRRRTRNAVHRIVQRFSFYRFRAVLRWLNYVCPEKPVHDFIVYLCASRSWNVFQKKIEHFRLFRKLPALLFNCFVNE